MWYEIKGFKVSEQANAVLAYLKGEWSVEDTEDCDLYCYTAVWYNGQEKGFSVTTKKTGMDAKALVVTFGEHRNTDDIFVDHWLDHLRINPPTVQDFTDEAYAQRRTFRYGDAVGAAGYVRALIERYVREETDDA